MSTQVLIAFECYLKDARTGMTSQSYVIAETDVDARKLMIDKTIESVTEFMNNGLTRRQTPWKAPEGYLQNAEVECTPVKAGTFIKFSFDLRK